jgi:hypothetical protein
VRRRVHSKQGLNASHREIGPLAMPSGSSTVVSAYLPQEY